MRATGTLAGEKLPPGLVESAKLEPAIFSPATKAETGHDENITIARMREILGADVNPPKLESMARTVYDFGEKVSRKQGIIIADTKFEFGRDGDGHIILIDEVMTPDSSPGSGRWTSTSPASRNRVSISSRCAIISTPNAAPAAGTATPRRRRCRPAWWRRPRSAISKLIAA